MGTNIDIHDTQLQFRDINVSGTKRMPKLSRYYNHDFGKEETGKGVLRTHKLRIPNVGAQRYQGFPLFKPAVGILLLLLWLTLIGANWRNTHTHVDSTHSLTHFTSTQLQSRGAKRQLSYYFFSACWVFSCLRNLSNSGMDYRIFNVRMWSFLWMRIHMESNWKPWDSRQGGERGL